ncbi:MAG: hypothetical protein HOM47_06395 [Euryarchaeota archaeon]|jgi:uncharacterized heparinase superfamily protein|nr:hypothetical protein [Euryarchaeota archaeon]
MVSELSGEVEHFVNRIKQMPLSEAIVECIGPILDKNSDLESSAKFIAKKSIKLNPTSYLFADSTAVQGDKKILSRAQNCVENGFLLNGHKYNLESPFTWDHPGSVSRNHQYKIQAWIMMDELLRASLIDSNNTFLETSTIVAIDWIDNFLFGDKKDDFCWYDMGTGQRSALLAFITQKIILENYKPKKLFKSSKFNYSCENLLKLVIAAEIHILELLNEERLAIHSNHGLFQMAGLLALSKSLPILKSAERGRKFAIENIEIMLNQHFLKDGFHKEHSPMYHMFMSNYLFQLSSAGWLDENSQLKSLTKNAIQCTKRYIMPNGFFTPLGDSNMRYPAKGLCLFDVHEDKFGSPSCPPGLHIYNQGGVAILATEDAEGNADEHLLFSAQFHSRQHKHADDLSFNYCAFGKPYLIDAGSFTYHYDQFERIFVESTKAHNTIEIDGSNYSRLRLDAYGSGLKKVFQVGSCTVMEAEITHKNLLSNEIPHNKVKTTDGVKVNVSHRRILVSKPQNFLAIIDIIDSDEEHHYSQWLHFAPRLELDKISNREIQVIDTESSSNSVIHIINQDDIHPEVQIYRGQDGEQFVGWHSKDGLKLEENTSLNSALTAKSAVFSTIIDLKGNGKSPYAKVNTNGRYIRLSITHDSKFDITIRDHRDGDYHVKCLDGNEEFDRVIKR